jgi:Lar family restriction alleviation protein
MSELKPCPFCGGEAEIFQGAHPNEHTIWCTKCALKMPIQLNKKEAIAAWNRRTGKDINVATNADRIRGMSDDEMANWLDSLFNERRDDWKPIGCYNCINYGTHHSDSANKGTRLYECDGCDFEGSQENGYKYGILNWLKQPAKED